MTAARSARRSIGLVVLFAAASAWGAPPAPGKLGARVPPAPRPAATALDRWRAHLAGAGGPRSLKAATDSLHLVALRIEFEDLAFGASPPAPERGEPHDRFYFETQFHYLSQYFASASSGRLHLAVDVPEVVARAPHPQAYYGDVQAYDSLMVEMTAVAVAAADSAVDFTAYDGVIVVHAGPGQESDLRGDSPTQIWSGFLDEGTVRETLSSPDSVVLGIPTADGGHLVRDVIILPEWEVQDLQRPDVETGLGSLGVYAHEVGLKLGMLPLFDASGAPFPESQGVGNFDLMGYGLWVANGHIPSLPSAFNRMLMGWVEPIEMPRSGEVVLRDLERGPPDSVVVRVPISAREYFLVSYLLEDPDGPQVRDCPGRPVPDRYFEFRDRGGDCRFDWQDRDGNGFLSPGDDIDDYEGAEWDFFLTALLGAELETSGRGSGLLVLHVDEQVLQEVLARGSSDINGDGQRKAVDVEEADGIEDLDRPADNPRAFGSADDYFGRGRRLGPATTPSTASADGAPTGLTLELVDLPDSSAAATVARARVRVTFGAVSGNVAAPQLRARRALAGSETIAAAALPLADGRQALVVPAPDGALLLADAELDEALAPDGDPATLRAWRTVPPGLRGDWVAPPAVGDVDGDGLRDVVVAARSDSLGAPRTRLFGWSSHGLELRDLDADPATHDGLLATGAGAPLPPLLFDLDGDGRDDVVSAMQERDSTRVVVLGRNALGDWTRSETVVAQDWSGGPVVFDLGTAASRDWRLAWTSVDSTRGVQHLHAGETTIALDLPLGRVQMAAGDLDGRAGDELVLATEGGSVRVLQRVGAAAPAPRFAVVGRAELESDALSPLALADLDGNGTIEILAATATHLHAMSLTGAAVAGWPHRLEPEPGLPAATDPGRGAGSPLAADVDGDGAPEVLLHLAGGALRVCSAGGVRRRELEAALPARAASSPLLADLDPAQPGLELAAFGSFVALRGSAGPDSLDTARVAEIATWSVPTVRSVAWGEWGGGPGHAFRADSDATVQPTPNDAALPSFAVGPNPAAASLQARIQLTSPARVRCRIFDLEGEVVAAQTADGLAGTIVEFTFDVGRLAAGVYLAQMDVSTGGCRTRPVVVRR